MPSKIMVVDDEEDIRESIKMLLEQLGHEVILAASGMECLDMLTSQRPDLIITDFFMPQMSGRETIEKIRETESYKDIKIIFLTVAEFQGVDFEEEMKSLNISEYIQKPLDTDQFIEKINNILGE